MVCSYCGVKLSSRFKTVDHIIPVSRAGELGLNPHWVRKSDSNRTPCCHYCNQEKGNMLPGEWFDLHPEYIDTFVQNNPYLANSIKDACGIF